MSTCALWGARVHGTRERFDEHLAGLEGAADQAHRERLGRLVEPRLAEHGRDLAAELGGAALIQLARHRVALLGELGGLDRERRDLALGERLGVDAGWRAPPRWARRRTPAAASLSAVAGPEASRSRSAALIDCTPSQ